MNRLLKVINDVEEEVYNLIHTIELQQGTSKDVINKFQITAGLFRHTNELLIEHIKEGE